MAPASSNRRGQIVLFFTDFITYCDVVYNALLWLHKSQWDFTAERPCPSREPGSDLQVAEMANEQESPCVRQDSLGAIIKIIPGSDFHLLICFSLKEAFCRIPIWFLLFTNACRSRGLRLPLRTPRAWPSHGSACTTRAHWPGSPCINHALPSYTASLRLETPPWELFSYSLTILCWSRDYFWKCSLKNKLILK